ncbi:hypothetical protein BDZ85DRAFT_264628 [Elsinoe ampelina]|uniref:Uncharacterized protein n=1 Tax=Elsinoe ampelina TaxID=302913 RepID=A0A6A6G8P2_9PEZI|nr:hypothetical protein BDZ85DRAFT_264628 [Elsinoe ampelina]
MNHWLAAPPDLPPTGITCHTFPFTATLIISAHAFRSLSTPRWRVISLARSLGCATASTSGIHTPHLKQARPTVLHCFLKLSLRLLHSSPRQFLPRPLL